MNSTTAFQFRARPTNPATREKNEVLEDSKIKAGSVFSGTWERSIPTDGDQRKEVMFLLDINLAKEVLLVGSFTDWEKHPIRLLRGAGGTWHTAVELSPGRHSYRFLVDGQSHDDPNHAYRIPNSFGTFDHVIEIS